MHPALCGLNALCDIRLHEKAVHTIISLTSEGTLINCVFTYYD